MKTPAKVLTAFGCAGVLSFAGLGIASASIPDSSGVIHGCYKPNTNGTNTTLGVIDTAKSGGSCPTGDTALTWNQTGPQGPAGPTGPTGPQGPTGAPGLADVNVVTGFPTGDGSEQETDCPAGQVALSVVFEQVNQGVFDETISVHPVINGSGQPTGYVYQDAGSGQPTYEAHVTCASTG
jgi:hypothetical protein